MGLNLNRIKHIVALLFALATLAERAAGRNLVIRMIVGCILRRAEMVALAWVVGLVAEPEEVEAIVEHGGLYAPAGCTPVDLLALAASLRVIALFLAGAYLTSAGDRRSVARDHAAAPMRFVAGRRIVPLFDTS